MDRKEALIGLNLIRGLGSATIHRLLSAFESTEEICVASPAALKEILGRYATEEILQAIRRVPEGSGAAQEIQRAAEAGAQVVTLADPEYPEWLKTISDPPPVLYVKGALIPEDAASVAIVGTRRASMYGLTSARQLAHDLAVSGVTVVSGLAEGIDGAAHEGALEGKGRTIAVLGHGLDHLYPACHHTLAQRIAESGALISEFPMGMPPAPDTFPRRNRVIAGLSLGVVVAEAPLKSGALITAREAMEQGKEVFAVPGPISSPKSRGCHQLIQDGAKLVQDAGDVLQELAVPLKAHLERWKQHAPSLFERDLLVPDVAGEEQKIFEAIPVAGTAAMETLARQTGVGASHLLSVLTQLELKGRVEHVPGQGYTRV